MRQYRHWTGAYRRPGWLKEDTSRTILGETLQRALEADGTRSLDILGETHEQVDRVEVRGRYCQDLLLTVLAQIRPSTKSEWLECVVQTVEAKSAMIRRCGCSPCQIVVGRNPATVGDLLQNQSGLINSSSTLHDDLAHGQNQIHRPPRRVAVQSRHGHSKSFVPKTSTISPFRESQCAMGWRGTGKGSPVAGTRDHLGRFSRHRCNNFVAMLGSVIKAALEQLRHRAVEEKAADRVVVRDIHRTAAIFAEEWCCQNHRGYHVDGDLERDRGVTEKPSETVEPIKR